MLQYQRQILCRIWQNSKFIIGLQKQLFLLKLWDNEDVQLKTLNFEKRELKFEISQSLSKFEGFF